MSVTWRWVATWQSATCRCRSTSASQPAASSSSSCASSVSSPPKWRPWSHCSRTPPQLKQQDQPQLTDTDVIKRSKREPVWNKISQRWHWRHYDNQEQVWNQISQEGNRRHFENIKQHTVVYSATNTLLQWQNCPKLQTYCLRNTALLQLRMFNSRLGLGGMILILPCISSCVIMLTFSLPDGDVTDVFGFFSAGKPNAVFGIALEQDHGCVYIQKTTNWTLKT